MAALTAGSSPASAMPIRKRSPTNCHAAVTKACGISSSPLASRHPVTTRHAPTRSASRPSRGAARMLPSAEAANHQAGGEGDTAPRRDERPDIHRDDRLDRHGGHHQQHGRAQHGHHRAAVRHGGPAAAARGRPGRARLLAHQQQGEQERHEDHPAAEVERAADADQPRQHAARQRPGQVARHGAPPRACRAPSRPCPAASASPPAPTAPEE